ncbi:MAG: amino acid permease [Abditibacteriota bacterium]|nr:amino acid permease [Abditibacteriota bacterium]
MASQNRQLVPYLGPFGAWALALGTSIGWGSMVITANTYLSGAGPLGSVLGLLAGALLMLIIARNYYYMMSCYPGPGGAYAYARECFGHDHGFLVSWFLALTYLAILWANATALPLFARYFFGDVFEFGKLYTLFGYDVYLGESLLTLAAVLLTALVCSRWSRLTAGLIAACAVVFTAFITLCFAASLSGHGGGMDHLFAGDGNALVKVLEIAVISPWAFIGFESISHASGEFAFRRQRIYGILVSAVVASLLLYVFLILLSVSAYPDRYSSWLEYVRDCGNLTGIERLPAFYAARHYLGRPGVLMLIAALLALIVSSLIGNSLSLSRLFYCMSRDRVLPPYFSVLNERHIPGRAFGLIAAATIITPFVGRTAIGWIVDITTLGAILVYAYVSACAYRQARIQADRTEMFTGAAGMLVMIGFGIYSLVPDLFSVGVMETVSYFMFVVWAVLGFIYFRIILLRDEAGHFGRSIVVWIALLSLVMFVSLVWMSQSVMNATSGGIRAVEEFYAASGPQTTASVGEDQIALIHRVNARSMAVVVALFGVAFGFLLNNYSVMNKKAIESETLLGEALDIAFKDPLTGVKSKHSFREKEKEADALIARGAADPFAMVVCDVNGLKHINDTYGHKAGDEYILAASRMICGLFVHSPVFRTGGDEFVVYLHGDDYVHRHRILQHLHDMSVANMEIGEVCVSAGMSDFDPAGDKNTRQVFERADALMYEEKKLLKSINPGYAPDRKET